MPSSGPTVIPIIKNMMNREMYLARLRGLLDRMDSAGGQMKACAAPITKWYATISSTLLVVDIMYSGIACSPMPTISRYPLLMRSSSIPMKTGMTT